MALQIANFVSGRMDNVVFYKRAGTYIARSVPLVVKQSAHTKIRSRNFGVAAAAGKSLRQLLLPVLPFPKDRRMQIRFSGAIAKWLQLDNAAHILPADKIPFVNNFQFNTGTAISERWKLPLTVMQPSAGIIEMHIPAFVPVDVISAPAHTSVVECTISAASCLLTDGTALGSCTKIISIPYTGSLIHAQVITLEVPTTSKALVITATRLQYRLADMSYCSNPAFMPASVTDARYC